MSSVIYTFKNYNIFSLLRFQRLQCLQSFTLSKTTMSFVLWFQDYNVFGFMIYKTSMSSILRFFSKTSTSSALSFIGLNVFVFVFLRTQRPLFFMLSKEIKNKKTSSVFRFYALRDFNVLHFTFYRTSRSSVWCYRTSMSFCYFNLMSFVFSGIRFR